MAATKIVQRRGQASFMLHTQSVQIPESVFQHYLSKILSLLQHVCCLILFLFAGGGHFIIYQLSVITVTCIHIWVFCVCTLVSMSVLCQNILFDCHGFVMELQIWRGHQSCPFYSGGLCYE